MALSLIPSSSSSNTPQLKYDVFISFRGEDTRCKFTSHLDKALRDKHIKTFIDYELNRGDEISASLLEAIEKSQISVIVFSRDYASSKWCLDELVKILECREKNEQMVIPVFYEVDPSDVRHQTGSFAKAFAEHEQLFKESLHKVQRWKDALKETANLSGWHSSTFRLESKLIEAIVQDVSEKTNRLSSPDTSHLVGIVSKIKEIESLLSIGTNNVRTVGIWGIGGIGKTTLAESVFNKISHQFSSSYFCCNVREQCEESNGLHHLQRELLKALLGDGNANIGPCAVGRTFIKNRLGRAKVLIVFDDVPNYEKIEYLIGGPDCLGPQSRIILTTRDLQVLRNGGVDQDYEVRQLIDREALELFSRHAFRRNHPTKDYMELSKRVAKYARGIPLALKVLGSHLLGRRKEVWVSAIDKLETIPPQGIYEVLKISYDGLDDEEKNIFLDIAHFLKSSNIGIVKAIIEACGFRGADIGIDVLIDKSLITVSYNIITMHDLLQAMAREIVRQESIEDPSKRSRLSYHEDIYHILTKNSGTKTIKGISLDMSKIREIHLNSCAFANMHELRFLDFYNSSQANKVHVSEALEFDFPELRYFSWQRCPIKSLFSSYLPENLVKLDMSFSKVEKLWNGVQHCAKLKEINFQNSSVTICPDLSGFSNLEKLDLSGSAIEELPSDIGTLESLKYLGAYDTAIKELPSSIIDLKNIERLGCTRIGVKRDTAVCWFLPRIVGWHNLTHLNLSYGGITNLPDNLGCLSSLTELLLNGNSFESIPTSITNLSKLASLSIQNCKKLKYLPALQLRVIIAVGCTSLEVLPCLSIFRNILGSSGFIYADFLDCCKLDPNITEDIVKDSLRKFQIYEDGEYRQQRAYICYPGSEIPKWFKFRSNESFINVELPPDWFDYSYVDFVLSVVVVDVAPRDGSTDGWCIDWDCNLKSKVERDSFLAGSFYSMPMRSLSNHVFVHATLNISPRQLLCYDNEITFKFYISCRHHKKCYKVEKCGLHLMFTQHHKEVNGSSRIAEDKDELIKVSGSRKKKKNRSKMERKKKRPRHPLLTSSFALLCRHLQ